MRRTAPGVKQRGGGVDRNSATRQERALTEGPHIPLSEDAALVAALAGTAMPFSGSAEEEVERWLRILRLHGRAGAALQGLGIGECELTSDSERPHPKRSDVSQEVLQRAATLAASRALGSVGTSELLLAVGDVYGPLFDRALERHGSSREELLERLAWSDGPARAGAGA